MMSPLQFYPKLPASPRGGHPAARLLLAASLWAALGSLSGVALAHTASAGPRVLPQPRMDGQAGPSLAMLPAAPPQAAPAEPAQAAPAEPAQAAPPDPAQTGPIPSAQDQVAAPPPPLQAMAPGDEPLEPRQKPAGDGPPPAPTGNPAQEDWFEADEVRVAVHYWPRYKNQADRIASMLNAYGEAQLEQSVKKPVRVAYVSAADKKLYKNAILYRQGLLHSATLLAPLIPGKQKLLLLDDGMVLKLGVDILVVVGP